MALDSGASSSPVMQSASSLAVVQPCRPGDFTFYATFDCDSECSYVPPGISVLLPASSYARVGLRKPHLPGHITDLAADCGGFVASRIWGDYRYSLDQYVTWLRSFTPRWAATMDYCCEPELQQVTRDRQAKTTANAWRAWEQFQHESWAWVPSIQGVLPEDYRRHALELAPLVQEMSRHYQGNPAWRVGIGTLCRRDDVVMVQSVVDAVRSALPGVQLHLWGIKLDALRSIDLRGVASSDSAVWHQAMYDRGAVKRNAALAGVSMRRYKVTVNLPDYIEKVRLAVGESYRMIAAQEDHGLLDQARAALKAQGWSINVRTRRNRRYVYAARRNGKKVEQKFICPVSELEEWLRGRSG